MKIELALYRWSRWPDLPAMPGTADDRGRNGDYFQCTPFVTVDFREFTAEELNERQLQALLKERKSILETQDQRMREHSDGLARIDAKIAELRMSKLLSEPPAGEERPTAA